MNNNHYSDNELHLMSYQDLRRLSILFQLPANIKKKYMISMIQAHQKGDGCMKTAITNKIIEERKVKRLNSKKKQSKSCMLNSPVDSQQIPTDLSVSTQHEFETRFSYVAHYSSKDEISSGISRIIKQEAEVSRRNRSILQQPRKPTRKLSTVGRTEIMLPRNHSLTTPVRLMPQYERGFPSPGDYEAMPGLPNPKNHFQDMNYNYHLHGEFPNTLMPATSNELYRSEPYWHTREVYNNSIMPILSSLLTPSSVTINSSSYASQYTSTNSIKGPTSFQQGVYENYLKSNKLMESQAFQSSVTNTSTLIVNNHMLNESGNNGYSVNRGSYVITKGDVNFEITSTANCQTEINCQHCHKRDDTVIKSTNENTGFLEFYSSRNVEPSKSPESLYAPGVRNVPQYSNGFFGGEKDESSPVSHRPYQSTSVIAYKSTEIVDPDVSNQENALPMIDDYESSYTEEDKLWEEQEGGLKKFAEKDSTEKEAFVDGLLTSQSQGSFLSEVSDTSTTFSTEGESSDRMSKSNGKEITSYVPTFSRCRYTSGHNKFPEAVDESNKMATLPSFLTTFCTNEMYNKAYSVCKNSFTGTTETHLNPIMTCTYASQFSSHTNSHESQVNNTGSGVPRQWYYTYPDPQPPFSVASSTYATWNEYSNEMDDKITAQNSSSSNSGSPNIQVVKCRTHGCHYLYSITNPCD